MSDSEQRIVCEICGALTHSIAIHLKNDHPEMSVETYELAYPGKPLLSEFAERKVRERMAATSAAEVAKLGAGAKKMALHEVFKLPRTKEVMNARGEPIMITVFDGTEYPELVPDIDEVYVFDVEVLKNTLIAIEFGIPFMLWGHAGCGKTTLVEQICARTKRPMLRVQHTGNTEESHIVGLWTARDGATHFEDGPLAMAMEHGWLYLGDEYDFAMPPVSAIYQPVLEGKSLVIKEAPEGKRVRKPHPRFVFGATGNTNGAGDETGLYNGTALGNSANYERFGVVQQVTYMREELEVKIVSGQGRIPEQDAKKLVDFAKRIREAYAGNKMGNTISTRALINAARIGSARANYRTGLNLSFINRLTTIDREAASQVAQRVFGS